MCAPPTILLPVTYHVGGMNPDDKRHGSYEGAGLSVSLHPGAWRRIARGIVSGDVWRLECADFRFLDAHGLSRAVRAGILVWAVREGLAEEVPLWRLSRYDDEMECGVHCDFASIDEAREERDGDSGRIRKRDGHRSTPRLDAATLQSRPSNDVLNLVLPIWAHAVHGLDGVWWADRLSPETLSAPRGVIRPEAVDGFTATRLDADPDGDEDFDEEDGQ